MKTIKLILYVIATLILTLSCVQNKLLSESGLGSNEIINKSTLPETELFPMNHSHELLIKNKTIYVAHRQGLSVSNSSGSRWSNFKVGCIPAIDDAYACESQPGSGAIAIGESGQIITSYKDGLASLLMAGLTSWTSMAQPTIVNTKSVGILRLASSESFLFAIPNYAISLTNQRIETFGFNYSTDVGRSWKYINIPSSYYGNSPVVKIMAKNQTFFALLGSGGDNCFKKSIDKGLSWVDITPPEIAPLQTCANDFIFVNNRLILTSHFTGLFISDDFGNTWVKKTVANGLAYNTQYLLAYDGKRLWAGAWQKDNLSVSTDWGDTWSVKQIGIPDFKLNSHMAAEDDLLALGSLSNGLVVSKDGGNSFEKIETSCNTSLDYPYCK